MRSELFAEHRLKKTAAALDGSGDVRNGNQPPGVAEKLVGDKVLLCRFGRATRSQAVLNINSVFSRG